MKQLLNLNKVIVDDSIPVAKSFKNSTGGLVLVCANINSREKLKDIISEKDENLRMKSIVKKKLNITIVGLRECYTKEEILNQLVSQNQFIKLFSTVN